MTISVKFSGGDRLRAKLEGYVKNASRSEVVNVGFLEGSTYPDGTPVPMVAAIQEFGAPSVGIPPRPYFRTMIAKEQGHWGDDVGALLVHHDMDAGKALELMGVEISAELQESIVALTAPELSPVTLLLRSRFGNDPGAITFADVQKARGDVAAGQEAEVTATQAKPLVWTGNLLNSVDYEVK